MSPLGTYLTEKSAISAKKRKAEHVQMIRVSELGDTETRAFLPCRFSGTEMFADVITGALYDAATGQCLSGKLRITGKAESTKPKAVATTPAAKRVDIVIGKQRRSAL